MKKITLTLAALAAAFTMQAQTVLFQDDFNDEDISDWTLYDEDGDGSNWVAVQVQGDNGPVRTPLLRSFSWNQVPLTPDNYAFSPMIDLSGETGAQPITLKWEVSAADAQFAAENYTVYVATGNTVADATAATITFNELVSDNGTAGIENPFMKTLDITSMAGQVVYVAFRHHNVSDEFTIEIDNVEVVSGALGTDEQTFENFNYFVSNNILNLSAKTNIEQAKVFNILGQQVITKNLAAQNAEINLNNLNDGVYLVQVSIEGQLKSFKVIKK